MNPSNYDSFMAIADPHRREILMMLSKEKQSINAIAENFDISRPAVSKHIKVLEYTGFVTIEEKGRERYCVLNPAGFHEIQDWIGYFESYWKTQFKNLEVFLKNHKPKKKKSK
jgi:DNA-binding transcriptional ArsR family regulator